jgi:hypothetical protein
MNIEHENFIDALAKEAANHEHWLIIIKFGLPTLLNEQPFLAELIVREAERAAEIFNRSLVTGRHTGADHVGQILGELGLKLESRS